MIDRFSSILILLTFSLPVQSSSDYTLSSFDSTQDLGLSPACNTVYTQPISACQPYDFNAINPCSASCIQALQSLQIEAQAACQLDTTIPADSMLAYFRAGTGMDELCSNMKRLATTLATTPATTPATAPATAIQTGSASTVTSVPATSGEDGDGFSLNKGTVLAIVISIVIAVVVLFIVGIVLYRKYYK